MDTRPGSYVMSALKKMRGTASFLALPDGARNCQIETFESCQTRRYMEEVQERCGCVPWVLRAPLSYQVVRISILSAVGVKK